MGVSRSPHTLRLALVALGLAVAVALFARVGWPAIRENLAAIGLWFPALALGYTAAQLGFALSWWTVLTPRGTVTFPRLFGAYLAGDAVNYLAPVPIAGEPVRVHLLRDAARPRDLLAALTVHKHADLAAQSLFVLAGVGLALCGFPLTPAARATALGGAGLMLLFLALMTWGLWKGSFELVVTFLARLPLLSRLSRFTEPAREVDGLVQGLYASGRGRGRFLAAVALGFVGWSGGFFETWAVLALLAQGTTWETAFAIEALTMALSNVFLFVPARAGVAEGVRVGVFVLLGLPAAQGAAYGLVRRARELVWLIPGAVVLARRQLPAR